MAPLRGEQSTASDADIIRQKQMEEFFEWSSQVHSAPETMGQKFKRKCKENPFIPIGEFASGVQKFRSFCELVIYKLMQ